MSNRRREFPPSGNNGNSKLRMDRKPNATRMSDPSHPAGRRKEIDNVMKKARQAPNEYWDKKLLEVEEKDPNRWRHTGYKKLYGGGGNGESSGSDREGQRDKFRYNGGQRKSRSRSPPAYRRSPPRGGIRRSPPRRSIDRIQRRPPIPKPRSPVEVRRRSPLESMKNAQMKRRSPLPYRTHATVSKRPPSPPPKARSPSVSSGSDDSYSGGASDHNIRGAPRSRSRSLSIARPRSYRPVLAAHPKDRHVPIPVPAPSRVRPISSIENEKLMRKRIKPIMVPKEMSPKRRLLPKHHQKDLEYVPPAKSTRKPPEPAEPAPSKKSKEKPAEKLRTRVKIEGESRRRSPSSSDESTSSENSVPATITATTRLTLSERFGKMAQNFSFTNRGGNMEKMQITKNSAGGDLKVLIQEGVGVTAGEVTSPPRKHSYSPAPQGHFPEELLSQAPTGMLSNANWEDVRVRFEYYKGRGYLRDLDLNDYVKWEEWWYRYQEWLKQERYYEMYWEKQTPMRRKRKIPIAHRLN